MSCRKLYLLPKTNIVSILISIALLFCSIGKSGKAIAKDSEISRDKSDSVQVVKILDGDTYMLADGSRIRLLGIDTPEKGDPFSNTAKQLADSLLRGRFIQLKTTKSKEDKYGRILGYAFLDGILVNRLLLERGLASVYLFNESRQYKKELIAAQKRARVLRLGIWSLPEPEAEPFYIAAGGSYRFHRPLCPLIKDINKKKAKKYKSRNAALDDGLSPCRDCRP